MRGPFPARVRKTFGGFFLHYPGNLELVDQFFDGKKTTISAKKNDRGVTPW